MLVVNKSNEARCYVWESSGIFSDAKWWFFVRLKKNILFGFGKGIYP